MCHHRPLPSELLLTLSICVGEADLSFPDTFYAFPDTFCQSPNAVFLVVVV